MKDFLVKMASRAGDLAQTQPLLALFLGGALLALFLSHLLRPRLAEESFPRSLRWLLYDHISRFTCSLVIVLLVACTLGVLRTYLRHSVAHFQRFHGRITEVNYNSAQTIWGPEQVQRELTFQVYYDEEITERIESEDLTKPAVLRKRIVRHNVPGNPFISARHEVTLKQSPRKKGSALYGGYETACRFTWRLKSPATRETTGVLRFPLPGVGAILDELVATVNGQDVLPNIQLNGSALVLERDFQAGEQLDVLIAFRSRGMSFWYFQIQERREIRDLTLALNLPDLPPARLNYPEGCMSPTDIRSTADGNGTVLTYRLDHAISHKGMGIDLPKLAQPGATTNAVLGEAERGWMLIAALLLLGFTLANVPHAALLGVLFSSAVAFAFGLLGDFSDLLFGFWGTAAFVLAPFLCVLAWLVRRIVGGPTGKWIAGQIVLFGLLYPTAAGLDPTRDTLYLNLCALVLLVFTARQLADELRRAPAEPGAEPQPAQ